MIYAVKHGLTAAEVLGRTRGNYGWFAFYALFVAAAAVHAPIGLRTALSEMLDWRGPVLDLLVLTAGIALALWGWRAVWGVFV
jgi:succinate dehydrogenase subunit C